MTDIRDFIPETPVKPAPEPSKLSALRATHFVVLMRELVSFPNRFQNLEIAPCDWLRIESDYPINIYVDRQQIESETESPAMPYTGIPVSESAAGPIFTAQLGGMNSATGTSDVKIGGACSFTVRRNCKVLRLEPATTVDQSTEAIEGVIHIFIGAGPVSDVGWGLPISHSAIAQDADGPKTNFVIGPIRPTIQGDNLSSGQYAWVPSRIQIVGVGMNVSWTGAAGTVIVLAIDRITSVGVQRLAIFAPGATTLFDLDLGNPVEVNGWATRKYNVVGDEGALRVSVDTSLQADAVDVYLRFRSFM